MSNIHPYHFADPIVGILVCVAALCFVGENTGFYIFGGIIGALAYGLQVKTFFANYGKEAKSCLPVYLFMCFRMMAMNGVWISFAILLSPFWIVYKLAQFVVRLFR